ncbi:MAG: bifunctional 4-hydroxy-2-oxoglutarate aldolase/2-dehydro-3-deoxy-phosphogluconate aldolase [Candidatus Heimdallarchaeota archaeon]
MEWNKQTIMDTIYKIGLTPVVRAGSIDEALKITEALIEGGLNVIEITFTVPGAHKVIETLTHKVGANMLIGAGTVLDPVTARTALLAGAQFIVSPISSPELIAMSRTYAKPVFPGCMTPTEVYHAWKLGADVVKIFPCDNVGGVKMIQAIKGPFPQVELIPTGGVNKQTAAEFIKAGAWALGIGSALIDKKAIKAKDWNVITENAKVYLDIIKKARTEA